MLSQIQFLFSDFVPSPFESSSILVSQSFQNTSALTAYKVCSDLKLAEGHM